MKREWIIRMLQVTVFTLSLTAVCQELEKPEEERRWHGKVAHVFPYDFRIPTMARLKETYWNPYENRVLTPAAFGLGWAINLHALLENLGIIKHANISEENFLMPSQSIKDLLASRPTPE